MNTKILLLVISLLSSISLVFALIGKRHKPSKRMSDENFTVTLPEIIGFIGAIAVFTAIAVMLGFTFLSAEKPHLFFYITFGTLLWLGLYLMIKTFTFKVVVMGNLITVYSTFRKPYSFTFADILSVLRQVKNNQVKSERMMIRTICGKKLIVESAEISYNRLLNRIYIEVPQDRLVGFEECSREGQTVPLSLTIDHNIDS